MTNEVAERICSILHRVARITNEVAEDKKSSDEKLDKHIADLYMCRTEILDLVEILNKNNGEGIVL